jgi:flagellar hook-associated protein FlgK
VWSSPPSGGNGSGQGTQLLIYAAPVASASHWNDGSNDIRPGRSVQFNGEGSDEDGTIVLYEWDFNGDGEFDWSGSNAVTSYTYMNLGTYNAVLRVTDNDGFTATDSRVITVSEDGDGGSGTPSISLIPALMSIGLIAILRRK